MFLHICPEFLLDCFLVKSEIFISWSTKQGRTLAMGESFCVFNYTHLLRVGAERLSAVRRGNSELFRGNFQFRSRESWSHQKYQKNIRNVNLLQTLKTDRYNKVCLDIVV